MNLAIKMLLQTKNTTLTTCMIMYLIIHAFFLSFCVK